jgi:hypothetical protein
MLDPAVDRLGPGSESLPRTEGETAAILRKGC